MLVPRCRVGNIYMIGAGGFRRGWPGYRPVYESWWFFVFERSLLFPPVFPGGDRVIISGWYLSF